MDARVAEVVARGHEPDTLTAEELDLTHEPLTRTPIPRPVRAWVRYGGVPLRVDAELVAWTRAAAAIRWRLGDIQHRAWVWGPAVEDRNDTGGR
ncbi:hypothetical protein [Protaetiibacter sp. SSC-01]|uniref:hypothetical protein n=1 Tax=Protaetiibacter sp. SSC-01 TaxID=2759943 RepID=UPI00223B9A7D|nr:hypothetical protein [Protaetiibacter sp. SSC-01]